MDLSVLQKGFNYSQDGPGNRLVYHLQGCNLHCPWCSNPESMASAEPTTPVNEILNDVLHAQPMLFDGGGVTFTGGEPTLQFEALRELLEKLKANSVNTAIETNGTNPRLPELFSLIDFLIIDFKHYNSDKLKRITGAGNETVLKNLAAAAVQRKQVLIRIPLINGFNASPADARGFASILKIIALPGVKLEVLRYHEYGKDKWLNAGREYKMRNAFVSDEMFEDFCNILKEKSIELIRT